jgi:outer membrane lipoprotein-sorting protein
MKKIVEIIFGIIVMWPLITGSTENNLEQVVKAIDELYRSTSSYSEMQMEIITPHWSRTLKMNVWSKGQNKTFIRILEPKKEEGIATLRIGNEMWNYLPKINKVMKIPPSMMMSSWMGSDFSNDDLAKEFTFFNDYTFSFTDVENPQKGLVYVKCIPKEGKPIIWGYVIIAAEENTNLPVQEQYYNEKKQLMRVINFSETREFDKRKIPTVLELVPEKKEGQKTILRYLNAQFDRPIDEEIFSLRNLRTGP